MKPLSLAANLARYAALKVVCKDVAMIGCLPPLILLILGAGIGALIGGSTDAVYGGLVGLVIGLVGMVVLVWILMKARNR
ncbi:hypothetical protein HED55_19790 [Ochrobactrum haematophilum]|uniref:Uncharacterized protein n=1 Tax=Brucella haematophila TaxID=419474 RepID=A0ABX1DNW7_9HYPH|nr:hypothetical protein [Brucella haematophila]